MNFDTLIVCADYSHGLLYKRSHGIFGRDWKIVTEAEVLRGRSKLDKVIVVCREVPFEDEMAEVIERRYGTDITLAEWR